VRLVDAHGRHRHPSASLAALRSARSWDALLARLRASVEAGEMSSVVDTLDQLEQALDRVTHTAAVVLPDD
jgi:hypothetical protein